MRIDKYHLEHTYHRYYLRYIMNRIESKIYDLFAHQQLAKITSRFISEKITPVETNQKQYEKIAEYKVGEDPKQVQFHKDLLYVPSMKDARLDVFKLGHDKKIREIPLPGMPVEVMIDPENELCFISEMGKGKNGTNSVICLDLKKPDKIKFRTETKGTWPKFMARRPHTNELWVSNWLSDNTSVIDIQKGETINIFDSGKTPRGIAFTPDGSTGYVCGYYSRDVMKFDADQKKMVDRIRMPFPLWTYQGTPRHIVIDNEGRYGYVSNMGRGTIHKIDLKTDKIIATSFSGRRTATVEIFPDQKQIAAVNHGETFITLFDTVTLNPVATIPTKGHAFGLDIHEKGDIIASVSFDTKVLELFKFI